METQSTSELAAHGHAQSPTYQTDGSTATTRNASSSIIKETDQKTVVRVRSCVLVLNLHTLTSTHAQNIKYQIPQYELQGTTAIPDAS